MYEGIALTVLPGISRGRAEASCHCPHLGGILDTGPFTCLSDPEFAFGLNTAITNVIFFSDDLLYRRPGFGFFWERRVVSYSESPGPSHVKACQQSSSFGINMPC